MFQNHGVTNIKRLVSIKCIPSRVGNFIPPELRLPAIKTKIISPLNCVSDNVICSQETSNNMKTDTVSVCMRTAPCMACYFGCRGGTMKNEMI